MKLSFDTIKSITAGAVRIWEESDGVHFRKCTEKQLDAWYKLNPVLGKNAAATTGIRLDFHTNSSTFAFTAPIGNKFEIYINDILMHAIYEQDLSDRSFKINIDKSSNEENRITLILPSHDFAGVISSIELDNGASVVPHNFDCKILFIGDSITQGWDSGWDSLSYAYRVSRFFNAESIIHGVGGGFFHESLIDEEMTFDPDVVIIAFGTNDWGCHSSLAQLEEQAEKFLNGIAKQYEGKKIFAISPIYRGATEGEIRGTGTFKEVCDSVKKQIIASGITLIDGFTLTPHLGEFFSDVTLHPNALGFGIYAENLIRTLQSYMK